MPIELKSRPTGYLTEKARGGTVQRSGYRGVFARRRIVEGELIAVWGGEVLPAAAVYQMPPEQRRLALQVDEDLYIVSGTEGPADWINHCCSPNAGMSGQISLVALRDITVGEEVCFDYAMTDGSPYDEFECQCGGAQCRSRVTGEDWRQLELQLAYGEYFSPYLRRRILYSGRGLTDVTHTPAGLPVLAHEIAPESSQHDRPPRHLSSRGA